MNESILSEEVKPAPPPWKLSGEGILILYKFSKDWVKKFGQLPDDLSGKFKGGLGYVMLVNYHDSPVGPYRELLIIPGKFAHTRKHSISKIYVDSEASTQNGRANWGIPKYTLPFSWESDYGVDHINIFNADEKIFACSVKAKGLNFPVTTKILPIDLHQLWEGKEYHTKPTGKGWGKLASIEIEKCNKNFFPPIQKQRPLAVVKVNPFEITFPKPSYGL